ncbi:MAG TPA: hypothetical protein VFK02_30875 [Kofleriaceae bacterium]|nr:hypothetical protein [Kofleriaceae bacterium]
MYRDASADLDERDRAVGAILIGEALLASCERAQALGESPGPNTWRAIRDAHDDFLEIWRSLDRARHVLARRGVNVIGYDELRPHVRTRLATGGDDADAARVDPAALDDARRAADRLKLAIPGADWAAIERRTSGLVHAPLLRRRRNRIIAGVAVAAFAIGVLSWLSAIVPDKRPDRAAALRRELAEIAQQRRLKIIALEVTLGERCDPPTAHELAKQLVMDGRGPDARAFAATYTARCGEDEVVARWANAPLPPGAR